MKVKQIGLLVQWECDNPQCMRTVMVPIIKLRNSLPGMKVMCVGNSLKHDSGQSYCTNWTTPEEILTALDGKEFIPRGAAKNNALPLGDRT